MKQSGMDSVHVKGRSFLILGDSAIYIQKDTIFYLPDSVAGRLKKDREGRSEEFYQKLRDKLSKRRVTKELYNLLFNDVNKTKVPVQAVTVATDNFGKYEGRTIGKIKLTKLEPFGTRITDTTLYTNKWILKKANDIQINTRNEIIKAVLFFKPGDKVDPEKLKDSERILRTQPYIKDARIYIMPKKGTKEVDVIVVVREIWSISGGFRYKDVDNFNIEITDKNFLGLGQQLKNEFLYSAQTTPKIGYGGTYTVNNIKSTFITGELTYARSEPFDRKGIKFYRNFITPDIKYAGGVELAQEKHQQSRIYRDTTITFIAKYNFQDIWLGRSFLIDESESGRTNFQTAFRFDRRRYLDRPIVRSDTNQSYFDSNLKLLSFGVTKRRFERSSLIVGYGRTEDIPIGYLLEFTIGRDNNEFVDRTYVGSIISMGDYVKRIGYLRPSLSIGGFIEAQRMEQTVIRPELSYFSYLYRVGKTNFRQFFNLRYVLGIRRFGDEFININNSDGIRGLTDTFLRGTKKLTFRSETVAFTPFYVAGFRLAVFGFADLAFINDKNSKLLKNTLYQGYGIGFRFRNENLAFNTIQIRLAWYPKTPDGIDPFNADFSGQNVLSIPDFRVDRPQVISFE
ncbi:MAG TPA: hypothetical protein PKL31_14545 [Fulvivirga sp.]|nr:hypothetical protein [Fulvivirga sp.]